MRRFSPQHLDAAFAILEDCACRGERCPQTSGPCADRRLDKGQISALARAGRILVEISGHNFRRVSLLTGPHAGKSTAANPDPRANVWQIVGKEGGRINGRLRDYGATKRQQPSAPRILTRRELKR